MQAQHQTIFGNGEDGAERGNCFSTCIACLLNFHTDHVPNFVAKDKMWWMDFVTWMNDHGFSVVDVDMNVKGSWSASMACWAQCLCIVSGKSPRGDFNHAVIGRMRGDTLLAGEIPEGDFEIEEDQLYELVHDPHPSGEGIDGSPKSFTFLVPNDPSVAVIIP